MRLIEENVLQGIINKLATLPYNQVYQIIALLSALPKQEKETV